MKLKRQVTWILVSTTLVCSVGVLIFTYYLVSHPGPVPRWAPISLACFVLLTLGVGTTIARRTAIKQAAQESPEERTDRRVRATKWLKIGLAFYVFAMLNGIRTVLQENMPWRYAVPGLAVSLLLILGLWVSLKRLKNSEAATRLQNDGEESKT